MGNASGQRALLPHQPGFAGGERSHLIAHGFLIAVMSPATEPASVDLLTEVLLPMSCLLTCDLGKWHAHDQLRELTQ